jgi:hypothetical protein
MEQPRIQLDLPDTLQRQFGDLERRLWRMDTLIVVSVAGVALLGSYGLNFISDRFWDTPAALRTLLMLAALATLAGCVWHYGNRWIWRRRSFEQMAAIVRSRHRRMGDRLLGIVELADERRRPPNVSDQLCRAAIAQVAAEAGRVNFSEVVATDRPRRYAIVLGLLALLLALPVLVAPQASWNALVRWALPISGTSRYTLVSIEDLPERLVVPHGETFDIEFRVRQNAFWRPEAVRAQFDGRSAWRTPVESGRVVLHVPAQVDRGTLSIRSGDVVKRIEIMPEHRPVLRELVAEVAGPEYLGYEPAEEKIEGNTWTGVEGSRVAFRGTASRDLREATMQSGEARERLTIDGATLRTGMQPAAAGTIEFEWIDALGLRAARPWKLTIKTKPDAAPEVAIRDTPSAIAMLPEETLRLPIAANDDFGLAELGVRWSVEGKNPNAKPVATGGKQMRKLDGAFAFTPAALDIVPDSVVTLEATALDYFPGREPSSSGQVRVHVLSPAAHAKLIQQRLEEVMAAIEEITRRQETLNAATSELKAQGVDSEKAAGELGEQAEQQESITKSMEAASEQLRETLKEALRNPELGTEALAGWAEQLGKMKELSEKKMPGSSKALSSAQSNAGNRSKRVEEAMQKEEEVLQALREMQEQGARNMDQIVAETLAMRLRKIAAGENNVVESLHGLLPEIIGVPADSLRGSSADVIARLARAQETRGDEADQLHGEIERFFDRTKLTRYGEVASEMQTEKVGAGMDEVATLVAANISVRAMEGAKQWATKFEKWADRLSEVSDQSEQAGSGGGEMSPEQMQALLALYRLRQQEESLRERTESIDASSLPDEQHQKAATAAAETQRGLRHALDQLQKNPNFPVPAPIELVRQAMGEAEDLLRKGITGEDARNAETDVINLLNAILSSDKKGSGAQAMLMQMMGMGSGRSGGGNPGGGDTNSPSVHGGGDPAGESGDPREVVRAGGIDRNNIPAEFREALESYYEAIETR